MAGKSVTALDDPLTKIQPEYLYQKIKHPPSDISIAIRQLRQVRDIDIKRYNYLKRSLPYVVCGIFNPAIRRQEYFGWINHFILDVDHISMKEMDPKMLKQRLQKDDNILMMFTSPGEDGLKILFRLEEKCFDPGKFSIFYKLFAQSFSKLYDLNQVLDLRTSDVTRACFMSEDADAYHNAEAVPVKMETYIDFSHAEQVRDLQIMIKETEDLQKKGTDQRDELKGPREPEKDIFLEIRQKLNPNIRTAKPKQIYIPEEMDAIVETVIKQVATYGIVTTEVINIHYGKKFRFALNTRQAEINVFYGKRGFSVVKTPRNGTDKDLNEITWKILCDMLI